MKKLVLLFAIALLFFACRNENTKELPLTVDEVVVDTLIYTYDSIKVYSKNYVKRDNYQYDTTKAIIKYPIFNNDLLNTYLEKRVTGFLANNGEEASYKSLANGFVVGYDSFFMENKDTFQNWFLIVDINVINQDKNYIALSYLDSDYSGGAHPNTAISFINYNIKTNQPITLDSLFDENQKIALTDIGENIFKKNEKLANKESFGDFYFFENGRFYLPTNFYISKKGLVFLYNQYEIKSYAEGTTELVIPFTSIKNMAKPNSILSFYH